MTPFSRYAALVPLLMFVAPSDLQSAAGAQQSAKLNEREAKMFSMSAGYERFMGRWSRLLAPQLVGFAAVRDGDRVLDVGTGTGALAAALVETSRASEIVGIDPSEGFIAYARQNTQSPRAHFQVGDAQAIGYPDASFDHTMSLLVMNFIPDHEKAIAEMRRVTRRSGTVSACVWDYNDGMQMLRVFWDEALAQDPAIAAKDERNMKLTREGQLGEHWGKAGLVDVRATTLVVEQQFASFADYWEPFLQGAGPAGAYVVSLPPDRREQLASRLRKRLLGDGGDRRFALQARAWCVSATVP